VKLYFPLASVLVDREAAPDKVKVAGDPLTTPEIVYVLLLVPPVLVALKSTSTQ
jgi:hypothetical protein